MVDITGYQEIKLKAVHAYESQFFDAKSKEPMTPIASKNATDSMEYRDRNLGRLIGVHAAEGYTIERYIGVDSIFDLI